LIVLGLYYGAWISQKLIRDINKGEYLLQPLSVNDHRNPLRTLTLLHFTYDEWDWMNAPQPQFRNFCRWMKQSILRRHPVIFGIFLPKSNYEEKKFEKTMTEEEFGSTRKTIDDKEDADDGCIPLNVSFLFILSQRKEFLNYRSTTGLLSLVL
jgi:hypothetical protein